MIERCRAWSEGAGRIRGAQRDAGREAPPCDPVVGDTRHYLCVQTHRRRVTNGGLRVQHGVDAASPAATAVLRSWGTVIIGGRHAGDVGTQDPSALCTLLFRNGTSQTEKSRCHRVTVICGI